MISLRATGLENARENPVLFGSTLASEKKLANGGSKGMFSCMIDVVRLVHIGEIDMKQAVNELHRKFMRFNSNQKNKLRQEKITAQMLAYLHSFEKQKFKFLEGMHRMQWEITSHVRLTGMTPWVIAKEGGYYSYFISERTFEWQSQLRFPLYQQYLLQNTVDCDISELQLGIYFADTNKFDFKSFSPLELRTAVDETGKIFNLVYRSYVKTKSNL